MKKFGILLAVIAAAMLFATPVLAAATSLTISPPTVELEVPADGSAKVEFSTYDFSGKLNISLENIPLKVEPTTVSVEKGDKVALTFYGDESLGSRAYDGKIRFLAIIGNSVGMGIKVKARIINLVEGQPVVEEPETESLPAETEEPAPPEPTTPSAPPEIKVSPPQTPETPSESSPAPTPPLPPAPKPTEFPIIPVAAIGGGVVLIIGLVLVIRLTRRGY